jgi:hypothetical protein
VTELGFTIHAKEGGNFTLWDEGPVTVRIKSATLRQHERVNEETGAPREYVELTYEALDGNHIGTTATERFNSSGWRLSQHRPGKDPDTSAGLNSVAALAPLAWKILQISTILSVAS